MTRRPPRAQSLTALAWLLWVLTLAAVATVPWLDALLRRAGHPDLIQLTPGTAPPVVAALSSATVGAVLASRRPRHPVGWLLLGVAMALTVTAAVAQYLTWGLLARPGSLPGARYAARIYPATAFTAVVLIGFVLLLTPTGALPSSRWRWWARAMLVVQAALVVTVTVAPGRLDPRYQALGGPLDLRGLGGALLVANRVAFAVTTFGVVVAAGSLLRRFRRAHGVERLQLRWLALAAVLIAIAGAAVLAALTARVSWATTLLSLTVGVSVAVLPVATAAAILQYRLYDLDHLISRTLAYGLLTILLGGGYAAAVLLLGQVFGGISDRPPSWAVAGVTLAAAAVFHPARRGIQQAVDRRFNRRRHDAGRTISAFSLRLRHEVDLDALSSELLGVVEETMEPTRVSLWLRGAAG